MRLSKALRNRPDARWNRDEVNVIAHQAKSSDTRASHAAEAVHQREIETSIVVRTKQRRLMVSSVHNVMRNAKANVSSFSSHVESPWDST
jgi:adenine C2-methylase RlmN of 23S rRNA A2503 and tRNA A37